MHWTEAAESRGVVERGFELQVDGRRVPGLVWHAAAAGTGAPLVLIGHGGTQHKRADYVLALARMLARHHGIASLAIDAPGHGGRQGDRPMDGATFDAVWRTPGVDDATVADWHGALDAVSAELRPGGLGYWGLSQGTMMGIPLIAAEARIEVAVLGLMGFRGLNDARLRADAPRVTCPLRFLVQWDDELIRRQDAFDLFDALGSQRKELRAHPGRHAGGPAREFRDSAAFLAGHLLEVD